MDTWLLKEAADWALVIRYGNPTESEQQAFTSWCQQSAAHEAAWDRAQNVFQVFGDVPDGAGKEALRTLEHNSNRRRSLQILGALLLVAPVGWLAYRQRPWQAWATDLATARGERRPITLPDGSHLVLNTASAINIAFSHDERRIQLVRGEILITTSTDPAPNPRPFLVDTPQGVVQALGTRFSVRRLDEDSSHVAVFEKRVEIRPLGGASQVLHAGEQASFQISSISPARPVDNNATLWEQGMLLANEMRLADLIAEMRRYRNGILRCDPAVANVRVSGAISLADTDAGLAVLERSLPLRIERNTRYWVTVVAR
jgi:transmembrane sensor